MTNLINALPNVVLTVMLGIIGYFLKRTINLVDKHETEISDIKDTYATKSEISCLQSDLKSEIGKLAAGIDSLKDNYIRKDDFVREIADLNRRQDRVYDILLEMKGEKANG
ncbi:MAG: hypothetical protein ABF449_02820 [Ethanoligenens sp.]